MAEGGALVVRRTLGVYVTVVLMSFTAILGITGLVWASDTATRLVAAGFLVFGAGFTYRALRLEVRADEDGLHVRGAMRTRVFEWSELRGADVIPGSLLFKTWYLRVFREGRGPLRFPDLSQFSRAQTVDALAISEMARHIQRRVRAAGGRVIEG